MLPPEHPDCIQIAFDDPRHEPNLLRSSLVANAGLLLPVTLAQSLGWRNQGTVSRPVAPA